MGSMRIAIIGGGFTGLTAGHSLAQSGHQVTIFEKEPYLGGLAYGFKEKNWNWHLEGAYHHLFTNDSYIISLIRELGLQDKLIVTRPITSTLWHGKMHQLDSPLHLLRFPGLSPMSKFRTAILLGFLKLFPFWKLLEHITAERLIITIGGNQAWNCIWKPLLYGKFDDYAPTIAASWFWARIAKRTPSLCYIHGGFHTVVETLSQHITKLGGTIYTSTTVKTITKRKSHGFDVHIGKTRKSFDQVLLTIPTPIAFSLVPELAKSTAHKQLTAIPHLHAQTLILATKKPILNAVYWLNVTDQSYPFLAAVAHTNFMNKKDYGGHHLTYFGNYLPQGHRYLSMTKQQLLKEFMPYIKRLNPSMSADSITRSFLFVGFFAQPVHTVGYSQKIPDLTTPITGLYMANMDYILPWDRGTNYAVELGKRAASTMLSSSAASASSFLQKNLSNR
jgi:protoporphyrinogen oxidase